MNTANRNVLFFIFHISHHLLHPNILNPRLTRCKYPAISRQLSHPNQDVALKYPTRCPTNLPVQFVYTLLTPQNHMTPTADKNAQQSLQCPVPRIHRILRKGGYAHRVAAGAPLSLAAIWNT